MSYQRLCVYSCAGCGCKQVLIDVSLYTAFSFSGNTIIVVGGLRDLKKICCVSFPTQCHISERGRQEKKNCGTRLLDTIRCTGFFPKKSSIGLQEQKQLCFWTP
jgi:hypothetical protein